MDKTRFYAGMAHSRFDRAAKLEERLEKLAGNIERVVEDLKTQASAKDNEMSLNELSDLAQFEMGWLEG